MLPYKDQIWAFHHVGSTVVSKVKVANCLPVCIVVVYSLVETDESFFLQVLSTDDRIVLALEVKNLRITEVISRVCWLVNQDLVDPLPIKVRKAIWVIEKSCFWLNMVMSMPWRLCHIFLYMLNFFLRPILIKSITTLSCPFHLFYSSKNLITFNSNRFRLKKQVFYVKKEKKLSNVSHKLKLKNQSSSYKKLKESERKFFLTQILN